MGIVEPEFKVRMFLDTCTIHNTDAAPEVIQNYLRAADIMPLYQTGRRISFEECNALVSFSKVVDLKIHIEVIGEEYRSWLRKSYRSMFKGI